MWRELTEEPCDVAVSANAGGVHNSKKSHMGERGYLRNALGQFTTSAIDDVVDSSRNLLKRKR